MRVAFFPPPKRTDPSGFLALLARAVEEAGVEVVSTGPLGLRFSLTETGLDAVHLHWLEYVATADRRRLIGWARSWMKVTRLLVALAVLRARGVGVVWTIHNLAPHEPVRPRAEAAVAQGVWSLADEIIVHSQYAATRVVQRFHGAPRRPLNVIPHANYDGAFLADGRSRETVREQLGIPPGAFVYLAFGIIRRYKQLGLLAERFAELEGEELRLLVAGAPSQPDEAERVRRQAARDPRILLRAQYIPDNEVWALHHAADAAVIAYRDVFSSGALLLALTHGLPVVMPAGGTGQEFFAPPEVEFFEGFDVGPALARVRCGERSAAARAAAERFPWAAAGAATVEVYRRCAAARRR